jgi:hypothetical protein
MTQARGYAPMFTSPTQDAVLAQIVERAGTAGRDGVAVFDLDGCLFDNRPRIIRIFRELASRHGHTDLYRVQSEHFLDWDQAGTMRRAGVPEARVQALHPDFQRQFFMQFFSDEFTAYDHAMPGAARLVWECYRAGVSIVYLTGRHDAMRRGSEKSLSDWGFPFNRPRTTLICKPDLIADDDKYKLEALREISLLGEVVIAVDNEPVNVNTIYGQCPSATVVWVETDHSPRPDQPYPDLPVIRGFLRTTDLGADPASASSATASS